MRIAFFVSSLGDTDLAKATIDRLLEKKSKDPLFIIPLTAVAAARTEDMIGNDQIYRVTLDKVLMQENGLSKNEITHEELELTINFIRDNKIERAYIGVPSNDNEIPFQIANYLSIPSTIAYEYMFKPDKHVFWKHIAKLSTKNNCDYTVPLSLAKEQILEINKNAKVEEIGHLSIDRSQAANAVDPAPVRKLLLVNKDDELIFISGTTQPTEIDTEFLDALLSEISTGKYPNLQLRMGIHPGIKDPDSYLKSLLEVCAKFSTSERQFKIILTPQIEKRLLKPLNHNLFILRGEITGSEVASAADKLTQAVPGALLNEAALKGKPVYFHEKSAIPYLPKNWFSENISTFFKEKPKAAHSLKELELKDTAPNLLSMIMTR